MTEVIAIFINIYRLLISPYLSTRVQWWCFKISSSWLKPCDKCHSHSAGLKFERKRFLRRLRHRCKAKAVPAMVVTNWAVQPLKLFLVFVAYPCHLIPFIYFIAQASSRLGSHASMQILKSYFFRPSATDPEARVRFPALSEKKSSGSGTGSTQPREYNWGATW
jgi:hypothetical protein